jgi:hypothetical protein
MALAFCIFPRPQSHIVIKHYIIANLCRLSDDNAHSMIDKESAADSSSWMDLDSGDCSNPV